jgi:hypothetical protein
MIISYVFVGPLPSYSVDTVHQLRMFYDGIIYFIVNDYNSPYIHILKNKYNVTIINYDDVVDHDFLNLVNRTIHKFCITTIKGREKLFIHAFERFYLLHNLMIKHNITDVFFVELDNLIYDNPLKWEATFKEKDIQIMFDNINRASSGICYIKNPTTLKLVLNYFNDFIATTTEFISEMTALYLFYKSNPSLSIGFLPIHWSNEQNNPSETYENFGKYGDTIFDSAPIGIYLGGVDTTHSNGVLTRGIKWWGSMIDYTQYNIKWIKNNMGLFIPYVQTKNGQLLQVNNLHVHSKELRYCLSDQPKE